MASQPEDKPEKEKGGAVTMQLMKEDKNQKHKDSHRQAGTSRIWMWIAVFFCVSTFVLVGVLIWREMRRVDREESVVERFPGLFRTAEEQFLFEQEFRQVSQYKPVNVNTTDNTTCNFKCYNSSGNPEGMVKRRKRSGTGAQTTHHACCVTTITFRSEAYLFNILQQRKKIAQFESRKQFFKFEECFHVTNFHYGTCQQRQEYVTAVTEDPDVGDDDDHKYKIEWLQVPGCCKCMN